MVGYSKILVATPCYGFLLARQGSFWRYHHHKRNRHQTNRVPLWALLFGCIVLVRNLLGMNWYRFRNFFFNPTLSKKTWDQIEHPWKREIAYKAIPRKRFRFLSPSLSLRWVGRLGKKNNNKKMNTWLHIKSHV